MRDNKTEREFIKGLADGMSVRACRISPQNTSDRTFSKNVIIYESLPLSCAIKGKDVYHAIFSKNGEIMPHTQREAKTIFVVDGEYKSLETGKIYRPGDKEEVVKDQVHGLSSDYCVITVVADYAA